MAYDNLCKSLIESNPYPFVAWLFGKPTNKITLLKTELSVEPIRADFVSFLQIDSTILHLEFQTAPDPEMPQRMLDYYIRLYRQYRSPIQQIVLFLRETNSELVQINQFLTPTTRHEYRVIRLWEVPAQDLLPDPGLWPLAILANSPNPTALLTQVAENLETLTNRDERVNLAAYIYLLGGLRFRKDLLKQLLREDIMRESVTYMDLVQSSEQRGQQTGRQQEATQLTLRQLQRKFGPLSDATTTHINALSLEKLEDLAEALLEFQTLADLNLWLNIQL